MRQLAGLSVSLSGFPHDRRKELNSLLSGLNSKLNAQAQDVGRQFIGYFCLNPCKTLLSPQRPVCISCLVQHRTYLNSEAGPLTGTHPLDRMTSCMVCVASPRCFSPLSKPRSSRIFLQQNAQCS